MRQDQEKLGDYLWDELVQVLENATMSKELRKEVLEGCRILYGEVEVEGDWYDASGEKFETIAVHPSKPYIPRTKLWTVCDRMEKKMNREIRWKQKPPVEIARHMYIIKEEEEFIKSGKALLKSWK